MSALSTSSRLLYIGDDPAIGASVAAALEGENEQFTVETASSTEAGLSRIAERDFDCVVAEYSLSGTDSLEFLNTFRESNPEIPFLFVVESNSSDIATSALQTGATDVVQRGTDPADCALLARRIETAVKQHRTQRQHRYSDVIENIPVGIYRTELEPNGNIVAANSEFATLYGADSVAELLGTDPVELYRDPEDRDRLRDRLETDGIVRDMEVPAETLDGETVWVSITAIRTVEHGRSYAEGVVQTIEDRKERERQLSLFRRAVESSGHSVYFTDRSATIEYVNSAFEEMTGYSADEAVGLSPRILKSGEHSPEFYESLWETILSGNVWRDEIVNRTKDGNRYVADQTIAPVEGPDGSIQHFIAINVDITERKRREQTLEQFRSAVEHAGHAVLITDNQGTIEYVNEAFEEMSGYSAAEAIGESPAMLKSGQHDDSFYRNLWQTIQSGEVWRGEVINERKDGETYVIDQTIAPIGDDTDSTGFVAINRDVTELKEYERKLEEQNERLKQYGQTVAHDLRNPMTLLKGKLDLFEMAVGEDGLDAEEVHRRCRDIREVVDRMELLVEDLLTMAEQGQRVLDFETVSIDAVAHEAWEQVETDEAVLKAKETQIDADPDRLRELFANLFRNSIEHANEDITVRVGPLDFVEGFFVEDNGPGIPPEKQAQVLERGFTTREAGTGFGLAIVEQIADAHGWSVEVTNGEEGGARFEFRPEAN